MYQRELKLQRGLKNKVQLQFKNSDQKLVRILAATDTVGSATSSSNILTVSDASNIRVGMIVNSSSVTEGTYISAIESNSLTLDNLNPQYDADLDQFLSPIIDTITSGTAITFNHNFVFSMFDAEQNRMVTQKTLEIIDDGVTTATRGLAVLSLTDNDTRQLHNGYYNFSVSLTDSDGSSIPAYSNTYYNIAGVARLTGDLVPVLKDSLETSSFKYFVNRDPEPNRYDFYSGNLRANPESSQLTTIAMYFDNFTGTVEVQATLDNAPSNFGNYATLETKTYTNFTGVDYANAVGIWSDVRIKWYPDNSTLPYLLNFYSPEMPGNPTNGVAHYPNGKIDKVLVRS
jgi:acetolactate synthase regulatory subunit